MDFWFSYSCQKFTFITEMNAIVIWDFYICIYQTKTVLDTVPESQSYSNEK